MKQQLKNRIRKLCALMLLYAPCMYAPYVEDYEHDPLHDSLDDPQSAFIVAPFVQEHLPFPADDIVMEEQAITDANRPVIKPFAITPLDPRPSFYEDPYALQTFGRLPIHAKFSGYIQHSAWWDSRQIVDLADDYVLAYPKRALYDADCKDVNKQGDFNMSMLESRLRAEFYGPRILGAKTFAYVECDFLGDLILLNRYRLRNVFIRMKWPNVMSLCGLFWHPMFVLKSFPLTVAFNGGLPLEPISRCPQISVTLHNKRTNLLLTAMTQLIFVSNGPEGFSSIYIRNSRTPSLCARISHNTEHFYFGAGINYLRLVPRLESKTGYKVHESINSVSAFGFATLKFEPLEIRSQLTYAQNAADRFMISGYAVSSINPTTDERTYTNITALGYWVDININRRIEPGLFFGITKNLGAQGSIIPCITDPITGIEESTVYAFLDNSENIDTVFRIAPRVRVHILPVDFAFEFEYTRTSWGCMTSSGKVQNPNPVNNMRILFTTYYYY